MKTAQNQLISALTLIGLAAGVAFPGTPYIRGVPYFNQGYNQIDPYGSCQNTCMAMALKYYGAADITPDSISARWGTDPAKAVNGWQDLFNTVAAERGLSVRDQGVSDGRLSAVRAQLDAGLPVVVHGTFSSTSGHLIVLLGYDDEYYYANDPAGDMTAGLYQTPDAGRHVRYPREFVDQAISDPLSGRVRFHAFHFDAAPLLAAWESAPPDSAVAGQPLELRAAVHLTRWVDDGEVPRVTADLSPLGGPADLPLTATGNQLYHLETTLQIDAQPPAWKPLTIQVEQRAGGELLTWQLTREIAVLPPVDQAIYLDNWADGWNAAEPFAATLAPQTATPVYTGAAALRVDAAPAFFPEADLELFIADIRPATPLPPVGYQTLRFAFHPGDSEPIGEGLLLALVNDDIRTALVLAGGSDDLVDLERRAWQQVEIPMQHFTSFEKPIASIGLVGQLQGRFYLDDIRLKAARPCPLAATWTSLPPDSVVARQPFFLSTGVRLDRFAPAGEPPRLTADLSELGGPADLPLESLGSGIYRLEQTLFPGPQNGVKQLAVRLHQVEGETVHAMELNRAVVVLPTADLPIFADHFAPGWEVEYIYGATLDPDAVAPVHEGRSSLAVQAENFTVDLATLEPVEPVGYRALHLAFHPGEVDGGRKPAFNVIVNQDARTVVKLLGGQTQDFGLRLDLPAWQEVEIPLAAFGDFEGPLTALRLLGNLRGNFYLDDVRLVAARPASPATAVETTAAPPRQFALLPAYPNPFNTGTTIGFVLDADMAVDLDIFNLLGQRVRHLAQGWRAAGLHAVPWDGRDDQARVLATGSYLCRLHSSDRVETRKLLLIR